MAVPHSHRAEPVFLMDGRHPVAEAWEALQYHIRTFRKSPGRYGCS
jgi:hypothetical protein